MNCKPGDLAIVIDAKVHKRLVGLVVRVHEHIPIGAVVRGYKAVDSDGWHVSHQREGDWLHSDSRLRPIRDNDGEDEMLRIAGKPVKGVA